MLKTALLNLVLIFNVFGFRLWSLTSCIQVRVSIDDGIMDFASRLLQLHGIRQRLS
jgi:hypothetical protein